MLQFVFAVELETLHNAEAVAQRRRQQTRPGGGANQRKRLEIELDRARRRSFTDHDVELKIFHGRVQHFFDHRAQAMNLIDKQHIAFFQAGKHRSQIAGLRSSTGPEVCLQVHVHFVGNDIGERGFTETRAGRKSGCDRAPRRVAGPRR